MKRILICFTLLIFGVGCQPVVQTQLAPQPTPSMDFTTPSLATQEPKKDSTPMNEYTPPSGIESLIEMAKEDLAQRLSIELTEISLVEARSVVWSNASLGCPRPDMAYAEVLTPGYLIILKVNAMEYEYHASKGAEIIYCENPSPPVPGTPGDI